MNERIILLVAIVLLAAAAGAAVNARLRRRHAIERIDPADIEGDSAVVVFTSPYCHGCRQWLDALADDEMTPATIDIAERPDAAARYRIKSTPHIAVVDDTGAVVREFHHHAPRRSDLDLIARLAS